jgi:hypothetical protein
MAKKITLGQTAFEDLYQYLGFETQDKLYDKKASLFPIGKSIDEISTTSIFLASLKAVKEYREELISNLGIKKITNKNVDLHIFTEVSSENKDDRPDGLIVLTSGKKNPIIEWMCLVEAKVGNSKIDDVQVERYIDFATSIGIDSILTISNQLVSDVFESVVKTKKAKKFRNLYHWSWTYVSVEAKRLLKNNVVKDEDHIFILSELRRYFDKNPNIKNFNTMDSQWKDATKEVLEHGYNGKISKDTIRKIINSFKQEEQDIGYQLTDKTGYHVQFKTSKQARDDILEKMIQEEKRLCSTYYIKDQNEKQTFDLELDLISRTLKCITKVSINSGKAQAQTTKLLNAIKDPAISDDIKIRACYVRKKSTALIPLSILLKEQEKKEIYSIVKKEYGDTIKEFEITMMDDLGSDMYKSKKIVEKMESLAEVFLNKVFINFI